MSNIAIKGATTGTGTFTIESPATNTDRTLTLPDEAGTVLTSASTTPPNVARFHATLATDSSGVADITAAVAICDTETVDSAGAYDTSTGVFTAPADGAYFFYSSLLIDATTDTTNRDSWVYLELSTDSGSTYTAKAISGARWAVNDVRMASHTVNIILPLNTGDKVRVGGMCNTTDSSTWKFVANAEANLNYPNATINYAAYSYFGGYRIA